MADAVKRIDETRERLAIDPGPEADEVRKPAHYRQGGIECIDAIRAALVGVKDPFVAFCMGQVIRYTWRHPHKGAPLTDLRKAQRYLGWAVEQMIRDNSTDD